MLEVLTSITEGKGTMADVQTIRDISAQMQADSLCALGQLTPRPRQLPRCALRAGVRGAH